MGVISLLNDKADIAIFFVLAIILSELEDIHDTLKINKDK